MKTNYAERLAMIIEKFSAGQSIEEITQWSGLNRLTIEAVIRERMKLADRKGRP